VFATTGGLDRECEQGLGGEKTGILLMKKKNPYSPAGGLRHHRWEVPEMVVKSSTPKCFPEESGRDRGKGQGGGVGGGGGQFLLKKKKSVLTDRWSTISPVGSAGNTCRE
jgi:hypothetical protein